MSEIVNKDLLSAKIINEVADESRDWQGACQAHGEPYTFRGGRCFLEEVGLKF
jgi:hypothetical protein